jgi:hypothetical protein
LNEVSINDEYEAYFMFQPIGGQWVTLKKATWKWIQAVVAHRQFNPDRWGWGGTDGNPVQVDSSTHPTWAAVLNNTL